MTKKTKIVDEVKKLYPESETVTVKRSVINFQERNPKRHTKEAVQQIVRNFKKVGYLGGIIWNEQTGKLLDGHKRTMALDQINKYDGTPATDYDIRIEKVNLDPKTELEQNVFQTRSRTELDEQLMQELIPDIDYKNAGLDEIDLDLYGINLSEIDETINDTIEELFEPVVKDREAKKQAVKESKEKIKEQGVEKAKDMMAYVTLSFDSHKSKAAFMRRFDYDEGTMFINGNEFSENIERVG